MKFLRFATLFACASLLAACGGGGGSAGTSPFGSGSGTGIGGTGTTTAGSSLLISISSTTATAAAPATVTTTLKDPSGNAIAGQVVAFSTVGGLGAFNVSSALTDANGQATVKLAPAASSSNGADLVLARVTAGTTTLSATIGFQVTPSTGTVTTGAPSITVALSTASVTAATPATLTATVRDANGTALAGQVVRFTTAGTGFGTFTPTSALSDVNGVVTTRLTPASGTSNGADLAIAQATLSGALVTGSAGFSVTSSGSTSVGTPSIALSLSTTTVTTATPATVTAVVKDATGAGVVGQVVKFSTVDGLGALSVTSALTDGTGTASTTLSAASTTQSGADQVLASATVNNTPLQASQGFRLTAASVAIATFTADTTSLGAYGQTGVQVNLSGIVPGTPVSVSITSACIAGGKASVTPATATTTNGVASFTYRDIGCGATTVTDTLRASVVGSAATGSLALALASPAATSINFISATPTSIYLKGSGLAETSTVTFRVLDVAGNGLPGQSVLLRATTFAGGLTLNGGSSDVTLISDSLGAVTVRINSGTVPTPVRVTASLVSQPVITTVSSSLAIAVGLPSQLNFSLSQAKRNIEGFNIDGTANTYNIIASDRLGNPVPAGTAINFVTEGGQIEAIKLTTIDANGNARTSANFISSSPRPDDGRVTVVAYALGEESFLDQNGNNVWDTGEPFQELGSLYLDRLFNGHYNRASDQFIALSLPGAVAAPCATSLNPLLALDRTIPSIPTSDPSYPGFVAPSVATSCDGTWGKAYVRRAIETVLSTSAAGPVWNSSPSGLYSNACPSRVLTVGYNADESPITVSFVPVGGGGTTLYNAGGAYSFLVADANGVRLNPMAAGTTISVSGSTGVTTTLLGGSPVASTTEASFATFTVAFAAPTTSGTVSLTFTSPSGLSTTTTLPVSSGAPSGGSQCP